MRALFLLFCFLNTRSNFPLQQLKLSQLLLTFYFNLSAMAAILKKTQQKVHHTKVCPCIRRANEITINRRRRRRRRRCCRCRVLCVSIKRKAKLARKVVLRRPSSGAPTSQNKNNKLLGHKPRSNNSIDGTTFTICIKTNSAIV